MTSSKLRWSRKSIPFVWVSLGQKKMGLNQICYVPCIWSWLIWVLVKILMTIFGFSKNQVLDPASGHLWWHQHGDIPCFNPWKISAQKFFNSNKFLRKKEIILKTWTCRKRKFILRRNEGLMNFRIKERLMLWISGSKTNLFQLNKLVQRWSFHSIYEAWVA